MLCDQEPQILSQWFSAILLLCICVIHPAIKAHVLNIANFGATNQPILITVCRLQISNWEILDLTFIINQHFCLLCIWFRNIHCCSQHLIGDVLLNTALLHIRVEVLPYHLFCLNEVVFRKKFSCFWKGMRLRRVRVWKQIGGFVQTLNCALRQMLDTRKWEQRRNKEGEASADQYSFRFKDATQEWTHICLGSSLWNVRLIVWLMPQFWRWQRHKMAEEEAFAIGPPDHFELNSWDCLLCHWPSQL